MVIIVGQDKLRLGALIVPDFESLKEYAVRKNLTYTNNDDLIKKRSIVFFQDEQKRLISKKMGFNHLKRLWALLCYRRILIGKGEMTESLKLRRFIIHEKYQNEIDRICAK